MSDILHYYLDLLRGENNDNYGFHNILNTMKLSRHEKVFGECFDGLDLHNEPLVNIQFSDDDGKNASSFRGCKVSKSCFLSGHSAPIVSMEFIDDNTLVSTSRNEVITWDIQSGIPIEMMHLTGKKLPIYFDNHINMFGNKGKSMNTTEIMANRNIKIPNELVSCTTKKFRPIYALYNDRLIIAKSNPSYSDYLCNSYSDKACDCYYLCDLYTDKAFPCYTEPDKILQVGSKYVYYDDKEFLVYDINNDGGLPVSLNILLPQKVITKNKYGLLGVFLSHIADTDYIIIEMPSKKNDSFSSDLIIVNISNQSILTKTIGNHYSPTFVWEIDDIYSEIRFKEPYISGSQMFPRFNIIRKFDNTWGIVLPIRCAVSKNKKYICMIGYDYSIRILSLYNGNLIKVLGGNVSFYSAMVSNDRRLALFNSSSPMQHYNILWDIKRHQIKERYYSRSSGMMKAIFSPDGKNLIIHDDICINSDNTAKLIHIDNSEIISINLMHKQHNFSSEIFWDYSKQLFYYAEKEYLNVYSFNAELVSLYNCKEIVEDEMYFITKSAKTSNNGLYLVFSIPMFIDSEKAKIAVVNTQMKHIEIMDHNCVSILDLSDNGRYVTVVSEVDFVNAIIKTVVLDVHEKTISPEEIIENDYVLLNYLKQFYIGQDDQYKYRSDGWTITVPSSPDDSTYITAYLVPNLYIKNCDFGGCIFDDETKEIIRQYNGIV